jgi:hypothetical protein
MSYAKYRALYFFALKRDTRWNEVTVAFWHGFGINARAMFGIDLFCFRNN